MFHRRTTKSTFCRDAEFSRHFLRLLDPRSCPFQVPSVDEAQVQLAAVIAQGRIQILEWREEDG